MSTPTTTTPQLLEQSQETMEELASPSTPTTPSSSSSSVNNAYHDQLSSYREKHRVFKEKKKNQDMASLTAFLIASKYESNTLISSGLERHTPKATGFCNNTPTNTSRSKVSFRASNVRGRGLPTVQPGSWFKPTVLGEDLAVKRTSEEESSTSEMLNNLSLKEEVVVSSSTSTNASQSAIPVQRIL